MCKCFLHDRGVNHYKETGMILENQGTKGIQLNSLMSLVTWGNSLSTLVEELKSVPSTAAESVEQHQTS